MLTFVSQCRVVCVGGDGIVHEVINGLLVKAHREAGIELSAYLLPENFAAVMPRLKIGVIPAGEETFWVVADYDPNNFQSGAFVPLFLLV